jgi:hypothetical protein
MTSDQARLAAYEIPNIGSLPARLVICMVDIHRIKRWAELGGVCPGISSPKHGICTAVFLEADRHAYRAGAR